MINLEKATKSEKEDLVNRILEKTRSGGLEWNSAGCIPNRTVCQTNFDGLELVLTRRIFGGIPGVRDEQYGLIITRKEQHITVKQGSGFVFQRSPLKRVFDAAIRQGAEREKETLAQVAKRARESS